jgi:polysaccharide export outer membrane protein
MASSVSSDIAPSINRISVGRIIRIPALLACGFLAALWWGGCATTPAASSGQTGQGPVAANQVQEELNLKEGDVLKISFPSVPSMDTTQPVRQDGRITLPIIGEFVVTGKTTDGLSKELLELYSSQLVSKEVTVTLLSSNYTVYVTGAVLRPGKIVTDRRLTALDAIMEAGGFDKAKADLKAVVVVRQEDGQTKSHTVNLQQVFSGGPSAPFYLKPFDSVYVPEKFSWF